MILLKSKAVQALLGYFFLNEDTALYVNELSRRIGIDKRLLVPKLKELESEGLMESEFRGNQRYFSLNRRYSLYKEIRGIVQKTMGIENQLKELLRRVKGVRRAFIFGSYARDRMDAGSDVDLMVIGSHASIPLVSKLSELEKKTGREINAISVSEAEFERKKAAGDPFISGLLANRQIELL